MEQSERGIETSPPESAPAAPVASELSPAPSAGEASDIEATIEVVSAPVGPDGYPPEAEAVIALLVTAQQTHVELSNMADTKASILMGATFVVFALAIDKITSGESSVSLLLLTLFSLGATVFSVLAIRPKILKPPREPGPHTNLLFFGGFTGLKEDDYIERVLHIMKRMERIYRALARDLYQNGQVLQNKKYKYLSYAYTLFLAGLLATVVAFVVELWLA